jgi:DNA-binding HxlR family transcriptional regulator
MKRCPPLGDPAALRALQDALYVAGVPGITTRMLSKELKELEMNSIITRTVHADIPVTVLYEPTDYSKVYGPIILALIEFGRVHQQKVKAR